MCEKPLADPRRASVARLRASLDDPSLMLGSEYEAWLDSLDPSDCGFAGEEADYSWRKDRVSHDV